MVLLVLGNLTGSPGTKGMTDIILITGANKGLGFETARRLSELGHTVLLGARDAERGQAAADRLGVRFVRVDVTDDTSVLAAAADVETHEGRLDTLLNNAGITNARVPAAELRGSDALAVFDTNVAGVVRVPTPLQTSETIVRGK